jgi:hypothetical protein
MAGVPIVEGLSVVASQTIQNDMLSDYRQLARIRGVDLHPPSLVPVLLTSGYGGTLSSVNVLKSW